MATEDDKVNTGALGTLVAVGTAAMIGIALAVNALVRHEVGSLHSVRDEVGGDAYRSLKRAQLDKLDAPAAWSDREKGHVSIPIDRAMQLVITDLKRSPWNATPAPPPDAGTDAAVETADAGADAAVEASDAGTDAAATPEPPAPAPLSPSAAPPSPTTPASARKPTPVPAPTAPAPKAVPAAPTAAAPTPAPAPAAPAAPPATPATP